MNEAESSGVLAALGDLSPELVCLTTEGLGAELPDQGVSATLAEVADWRWRLAPFDVVIVTPDLDAAVLMSVDEFALVGGSREWLEKALGKSISQARDEFRSYAHDMSSASRHLIGLADRYR
ncbi:hypothetical protein AAFP30_22250 [Gordonia sp. CPCC 205515]|uniref:hypothetical protein n=1 Tax=Gordonia sp. CPCC 205515 TaxID=3140791 RepID=UPI003AF3414E